uniref:NADH dehydrogenase subunit 6 n=1 Tax=Prodasineura autumnalis TaxID=193254 RepID=UPI0030FEDA4B
MSQIIMLGLSTSNSLSFTVMKHPMSMGIMLMIQTVLVCGITNCIAHSAWFSYILFLVFLGGMLVLFIYMTSVASNEMFEKYSNLILIFIMVSPMVLLFMDPIMISNLTQESESLLTSSDKNVMTNYLFNYPINIMTIIAVLYLFLTLIVVVKMTEAHQGPLRSN